MTVFHADLDHTLIYSYRHEIGEEKICAEHYEGREISFMTRRSFSLLQKVREKVLFVPTTTRTEEQYRRIDLGAEVPDYALVCNGGVLLRAGEEVPSWYEESLRRISDSREALQCAEACMQRDPDRNFEVRNIRGLFLFTKSGSPQETSRRLEECLDQKLVKIFTNGSKVYALPEGLDKGTAVRRFRDYIRADAVLAAGDSMFDIPMLEEADRAYAPAELMDQNVLGAHVERIPGEGVFSDLFLERILTACTGCPKDREVM